MPLFRKWPKAVFIKLKRSSVARFRVTAAILSPKIKHFEFISYTVCIFMRDLVLNLLQQIDYDYYSAGAVSTIIRSHRQGAARLRVQTEINIRGFNNIP